MEIQLMEAETPGTETADTMTDTAAKLKWRHELKFEIGREKGYLISGHLGKIFKRDSNAGSHGIYRVSSLYFDDLYDRALREKLNGTDQREKLRLRYYNEDTDYIRLELKLKRSGLCAKLQQQLSKAEGEKLIACDMDQWQRPFAGPLNLYAERIRNRIIRPSAIVCYDREAFIYGPGNVRITIDRHIRGSREIDRFFDAGRHDIPFMGNYDVLELKYDGFLPDMVREVMKGYGLMPSSCSKYVSCRRYG